MKRDFLKTLNVEKPCAESWDEMRGDDKMRFCKHCAETVNNISEMTISEIEKLAAESNGKFCMRYVKTADKGIITKDVPRNFTPSGKRISQFAAGIFGAALSVSGVAAQATQTDANANQPRIESKIDVNEQNDSSVGLIKGVVKDENGAVIPNATVILSDAQGNKIAQIFTDSEGTYSFLGLSNGIYYLEANATNFMKDTMTRIEVKNDNAFDISITLKFSEELVTAGYVIVIPVKIEPLIDVRELYLFDAVTKGEISRIKKLLKNKQLISAKDAKGASVLAFAHDAKTAKLLIKYNADVNAKNVHGETALMNMKDVKTMKVLIGAGANIDARDNKGKSVLKHALESGNTEVIDYLKSIGVVE